MVKNLVFAALFALVGPAAFADNHTAGDQKDKSAEPTEEKKMEEEEKKADDNK